MSTALWLNKKRKTYLLLQHNSDQKIKSAGAVLVKRYGFGVTGATQQVRQPGTSLGGCKPSACLSLCRPAGLGAAGLEGDPSAR